MATVTISSTDYEVYDDIATADQYLAADFGADVWRAETEDDPKARALVTSTRILNRMPWADDRDWPRPGTADTETGDIPQPVLDASIVLAKLIHAGSKVDSQASTQSGNIRRQQAGSVAIEYFYPTDDPTRLPVEVMELIRDYLGGVTISNLAFGTDGCSITERGFEVGWDSP